MINKAIKPFQPKLENDAVLYGMALGVGTVADKFKADAGQLFVDGETKRAEAFRDVYRQLADERDALLELWRNRFTNKESETRPDA